MPLACGSRSLLLLRAVQADMMELKASTSRDAEAVVVEARMDKGQGPVATVRHMHTPPLLSPLGKVSPWVSGASGARLVVPSHVTPAH